jgi:hypothetical protein
MHVAIFAVQETDGNENTCSTLNPPLSYRQEVSSDIHGTKSARPRATRAIPLNLTDLHNPSRDCHLASLLPTHPMRNLPSQLGQYQTEGNRCLLSPSWIVFLVSNSDGDDEILGFDDVPARRGFEPRVWRRHGCVLRIGGKRTEGSQKLVQ